MTDGLAALRVRSHLAHETASVLKPLKAIVGELMCPRGNKVFQVVTPARYGFPGFFAVLRDPEKVIFTNISATVFMACA
ncbi:hypothetical protein U0E23_24530 [Burkholderia stagnalis]|uniref:hypothetical protein n=1 Tax=Burkholderia stagnalis TaxID=1503054 RepID=UPI002AB52A2F|nr:hypothetical protein [Burkholderia stagnalis]MDY7805609.1 hypothetical protein [Burkholderia stagnalis]